MHISFKRGNIEISLWIFFVAFWFGIVVVRKGADAYSWERPGCHKLGHTRTIRIPGCVTFDITSNACRGYCTSFAVPSLEQSLRANPNQLITSVGQCCNIMETEEVTARVMCRGGPRNLVFKSAKSCACFHCKKD